MKTHRGLWPNGVQIPLQASKQKQNKKEKKKLEVYNLQLQVSSFKFKLQRKSKLGRRLVSPPLPLPGVRAEGLLATRRVSPGQPTPQNAVKTKVLGPPRPPSLT